jgi:hypothetical protein
MENLTASVLLTLATMVFCMMIFALGEIVIQLVEKMLERQEKKRHGFRRDESNFLQMVRRPGRMGRYVRNHQ